jgi:hypothetical protein
MRCNACGIVFDGEVSLLTTCMNKHCPNNAPEGQFTLIGEWATAWEVEGSEYAPLALTFREMAGTIIKQQRTVIEGVTKYSYVDKGKVVESSPWLAKRELVRTLERIRDNKPMPLDVNGKYHKNWGTAYGNRNGALPVTGRPTYYGEFGMDVTIGPNLERHFTGERIVIGCCREFYYTSHHYEPGSWWVYNSANGQWYRFER